MNTFIGFFLLTQAFRWTESACSFPTTFQNTWQTNTRGTWVVNSSTISDFPAQVEVSGSSLYNMDCEEIYSGFYVLKSQETVTPFSGSPPPQYNVYTCLYLEEQSVYNYKYSLLTKEFIVTTIPTTVVERVTLGSVSATLSGAAVCSDTAYTTAGERVHVALLNGSESLGKLDCPSELQGYFTYFGTSCNSTSIDVCTDTTQLAFNTTACTQNTIYSQNGTVDCVYQNTIGSYTYVTVYNEDSSVDESNYYAFSCLVVSEAGVYTYASVKPTECEANQVSTTTPTGGYVTVFQETAGCTTTTTSTEDLTYLYVIIGLIVLLIIIIIIVLLICCCKCRKKQKDVESADDESDKGSEDGKSKDGDNKPDEDDSKQEMVDEQQRTKTDEDKQSVDSGFIPGKDEAKQKKKRRRRRRRRRRKRRHGEEGEEGEEEEDDDGEDEENSSDNVAHTDNSDGNSQHEQIEEEPATHLGSKDGESETSDQELLVHTEEKSQDKKLESSPSENEENMEPDLEQTANEEESMETEPQHSSRTEPETQSKSNHSSDSEEDDNTSQQVANSVEQEPETQSQGEKVVGLVGDSPTHENEEQTTANSPGSDRMEEETKAENIPEKSDDEGSETDDDTDEKEDDDATLKDGQKIKGEKGSNDDSMDEQETQKKTGGKYVVQPGQLSKVLVTREMEEKIREKAARRKSRTRGVRLFASKKSKKQNVLDETQEDEINDMDMEDIDRRIFVQPVAPFMEQYNSKKDIEKKLDEAHYWDLPEEDNIVMQLDQIEEELEKEEQKEIERMEVDIAETAIGNANVKEEAIKSSNDAPEEEGNVKAGEGRNASRSSSRADSPESKKVRKADSSSDLESDVFDLEDDCLPEGYIRNENGHIVRTADGKVFTKGHFQKHMKKARLKRLFNIPRLNRNKKGRPIGGIKDDAYGPDNRVNDLDEQVDDERQGGDGHVSGHAQRSSDERRRTSESRRRSKTVAFSDAVGIDKDGNLIEKEEQPRIDSSTVNRRKLKNRLFRKKKRKTEDLPPLSNSYSGNGQFINVTGADNDRPRELSNLVKVYGQPGPIPSTAPRSTLPPVGLTRSNTAAFDKNQLQNFRDGLSKDQEILEKANTIGNNPLPPPRLGVRKISVEELSSDGGSNENNDDVRSVELGSEDEFFLVGGPSQSQNEPLFTRVRPPPQSDLSRSLKSHHDQRHAIPWSILNPPHGRPNTDGEGFTKSLDAPRSADMLKRGMDEKRLRELLEELYKDKKYFDHVIDTTEPNDDPNIDDRFLAEHGRDFLLDRADFWEDRGPLPARPPRTSLGMRMSRLQTFTDSGRVSMTSTATCTPPVTELPNQLPLRQEQTFS